MRERLCWTFSRHWTRPCIGTRAAGDAFVWRPYAAVFRECAALALWLRAHAGPAPAAPDTPGPVVALCAHNRAEWLAADVACALAGAVSVGMHVSWTRDDAAAVLADTRATVLFCEAATLPACVAAARASPDLRHIVCFDAAAVPAVDLPPAAQLHTYASIVASEAPEAAAEAAGDAPEGPSVDALEGVLPGAFESGAGLYAVVYSSGTSGALKGVPVTRRKWLRDSAAGAAVLRAARADERAVLSYAPLAHGMDRGCVWAALLAGARIGVAAAAAFDALLADLRAVRPVLLTAMPHFWARLHRRYRDQLARACTHTVRSIARADADPRTVAALAQTLLLQAAEEDASSASSSGDENDEETLARSIAEGVRAECRAALGGRLAVAATGGAATDAAVLRFVRRLLPDAQVVDAYGTTEVPGISTDGVVAADVEVRLADVPELGYTAADRPHPRGEILCRAPDTVCRYWGTSAAAAAATRACYDAAGWYHTGDIGVLADGRLRVIDRRAAMGELYVHGKSVWLPLAPLEALFAAECPHVRHIYLHADRTESVLLAVVDVEEDSGDDHGDDHGKQGGTAVVTTAYDVLNELRTAARRHELTLLQTPRSVVLAREHWSPEGGELTPTMKVRRAPLVQRYHARLAAEYARLEEVAHRRAAAAAAAARQPGFDFAADYAFVCDHAADEAALAALFAPVCAAARRLRTAVPAASARARREEQRIRDDLAAYYGAAMARCETALAGRAGLRAALAAVRHELEERYADLARVQARPDPDVAALMGAYNAAVERLAARARFCCEAVPYQITAGLMVVPPATARARGGNCLAEGAGLPAWRVVCTACGWQIEWGADGAGTPRFVCLDCARRGGTVLCARCHALMCRVHAAHLPLREHFCRDAACLDEHHTLVEEHAHPVWMRDAVLAGPPASFAVFAARIFAEQYPDRPCVRDAAGTWRTYRAVWALALSLASVLQPLHSDSGSCTAADAAAAVTARCDADSLLVPLVAELAALLAGHGVRLTGNSDAALLALSPPPDKVEIPLDSEESLVQYLSVHPGSSQAEHAHSLDAVITLDATQLSSRRLMQDAQSTVHFDLHPPLLILPSTPATQPGHTALWSALLCGLRVVPPSS